MTEDESKRLAVLIQWKYEAEQTIAMLKDEILRLRMELQIRNARDGEPSQEFKQVVDKFTRSFFTQKP